MSLIKRIFAFLGSAMTRQNYTHFVFLGGIGVLTLGANHLGESLNIGGLGAICGGVGLLVYAYLLGAE